MCKRTMLEYLPPDSDQENKIFCYPVADERRLRLLKLLMTRSYTLQEIADYHRLDLQREVKLARLASLCGKTEQEADSRGQQTLVASWLNGTRMVSRRPGMQSKPKLEEVTLAEIKPALEATFSVMYQEGLISDYDEMFVEQFNKTFERELVHQGECHANS